MTEEEKKKSYEERVAEVEKRNAAFEKTLNTVPPLYKRVWFWLTCWRPVSKVESAHMAQAIVSNRRQINDLIRSINIITTKVAELNGYMIGKTATKIAEQELNKVIEKNKDKDVMYG